MLEQYLNDQIYNLLFMQLYFKRVLTKKMSFTVNQNLLSVAACRRDKAQGTRMQGARNKAQEYKVNKVQSIKHFYTLYSAFPCALCLVFLRLVSCALSFVLKFFKVKGFAVGKISKGLLFKITI